MVTDPRCIATCKGLLLVELCVASTGRLGLRSTLNGETVVIPAIARLTALAFLGYSTIPVAASSEKQLPPEVLKQTGEQLGRCAGVYRLFAFVDERQGKHAS